MEDSMSQAHRAGKNPWKGSRNKAYRGGGESREGVQGPGIQSRDGSKGGVQGVSHKEHAWLMGGGGTGVRHIEQGQM